MKEIALAVSLLAVAPHRAEIAAPPSHSRATLATRTLSIADLNARGVVRLAVARGTLSYFLHAGAPRGLEFDLLSGFSERLEVTLEPLVVATAAAAGRLLETGEADIAVLPPNLRVLGVIRARPLLPPHAEGGNWRDPPTGGLFVRGDSPELARELESHVESLAQRGIVDRLARQYLERPERFRVEELARRPKISPYDGLIAKHARRVGFDWRLVAALIFEESRFDPSAVSHKGAAGLMQLMPFVAVEVGTEDPHHPESNIRGGLRHLRRISRMFPDAEGDDLLALTLAAYLMGPAHVLDAQALAERLGRDPNTWWGGIEEVLPLLEKREHYRRARHGYAPGRQAVRYVTRIFSRYDHYKRHVGDEPGQHAVIVEAAADPS